MVLIVENGRDFQKAMFGPTYKRKYHTYRTDQVERTVPKYIQKF